jgi:hypothetical protein
MCSEEDAGAEFFDEFDGFWGLRFPGQELVELETVFHRLVIDDRVKTFESNDMSVIS